jgi:hypothetical protein
VVVPSISAAYPSSKSRHGLEEQVTILHVMGISEDSLYHVVNDIARLITFNSVSNRNPSFLERSYRRLELHSSLR